MKKTTERMNSEHFSIDERDLVVPLFQALLKSVSEVLTVLEGRVFHLGKQKNESAGRNQDADNLEKMKSALTLARSQYHELEVFWCCFYERNNEKKSEIIGECGQSKSGKERWIYSQTLEMTLQSFEKLARFFSGRSGIRLHFNAEEETKSEKSDHRFQLKKYLVKNPGEVLAQLLCVLVECEHRVETNSKLSAGESPVIHLSHLVHSEGTEKSDSGIPQGVARVDFRFCFESIEKMSQNSSLQSRQEQAESTEAQSPFAERSCAGRLGGVPLPTRAGECTVCVLPGDSSKGASMSISFPLIAA